MRHNSTIKMVTNQDSKIKNEASQLIEKELNAKILKITITIKDHYPEIEE